MHRTHRLLAGLALVGLAVAACGSPPPSNDNGAEGGGSSAGGSTFTACEVTDSGGVDDRSFNASAWQGLKDAAGADSGIETKLLQSQSESDYVPNVNAFLNQDCGLIVTVGFLLGDATKDAAAAHPDQKFAIVDFSYDPPLENVRALLYNTAQAGFLGGYLAAGMTKTGKVATFGGQKLPTVTIYMDGYWDGVQYYNKKHNKDVKVLGWSTKTQNGTFTGDFTDQGKGKNVTDTFIQQGADIIFPVAGPVGLGAAASVKQNGNGKVHLLWVDTDGCVSAAQYCDLMYGSVVKGIAASVRQVTEKTKKGQFEGGNYVGTFANDGVGLTYGKKLEDQIPSSLKTEIDQIKQQITDGKITVESPSQPKKAS